MTSPPSLPLELAEEIVCKLPVESIVRFRSVCKDWDALITKEQRFIYKLLDLSHERSIQVGHEAIQLSGTKTSDAPFCLPAPDKLHDYKIEEIIHCDGLLLCKCVEGGDDRKLAVWNPLVSHRLKWIEPSTYYKHHDVLGFGYDSVSRDKYKILRIDEGNQLIEIYEFKSKLWRRLSATVEAYMCQAVSMNGNMYWIAQNMVDPKILFIQSFDFSTETFKPIRFPEERDRIPGFGWYTVLLSGYGGDRLSLLRTYTYLKIEVWVTNMLTDGDVSWSKYFDVDREYHLILPFNRDRSFLATCIHETKKIMVWVKEVNDKKEHVYTYVYILGEGEIEQQVEATIRHKLGDQSCIHVYVPSLVPVPE